MEIKPVFSRLLYLVLGILFLVTNISYLAYCLANGTLFYSVIDAYTLWANILGVFFTLSLIFVPVFAIWGKSWPVLDVMPLFSLFMFMFVSPYVPESAGNASYSPLLGTTIGLISIFIFLSFISGLYHYDLPLTDNK